MPNKCFRNVCQEQAAFLAISSSVEEAKRAKCINYGDQPDVPGVSCVMQNNLL